MNEKTGIGIIAGILILLAVVWLNQTDTAEMEKGDIESSEAFRSVSSNSAEGIWGSVGSFLGESIEDVEIQKESHQQKLFTYSMNQGDSAEVAFDNVVEDRLEKMKERGMSSEDIQSMQDKGREIYYTALNDGATPEAAYAITEKAMHAAAKEKWCLENKSKAGTHCN